MGIKDFEKHVKDGVYEGPEICEEVLAGNTDNTSVDIVSLGHLKEFTEYAYFSEVGRKFRGKLAHADHLEVARNQLAIDNTSLTSLPKLRKVCRSFMLRGTNIKMLPELEEVGGYMACGMDGAAIPYMPKLKKGPSSIIYHPDDGSDTSHYKYKEIQDQVDKTPTEELVNLRLSHPHLANIIDARLRGV